MIAYRVTDVKKCMNELLCKDTFDFFLLQEATINTFSTFSIDGHRLDDFFSDAELEEIDEEGNPIIHHKVQKPDEEQTIPAESTGETATLEATEPKKRRGLHA